MAGRIAHASAESSRGRVRPTPFSVGGRGRRNARVTPIGRPDIATLTRRSCYPLPPLRCYVPSSVRLCLSRHHKMVRTTAICPPMARPRTGWRCSRPVTKPNISRPKVSAGRKNTPHSSDPRNSNRSAITSTRSAHSRMDAAMMIPSTLMALPSMRPRRPGRRSSSYKMVLCARSLCVSPAKRE